MRSYDLIVTGTVTGYGGGYEANYKLEAERYNGDDTTTNIEIGTETGWINGLGGIRINIIGGYERSEFVLAMERIVKHLREFEAPEFPEEGTEIINERVFSCRTQHIKIVYHGKSKEQLYLCTWEAAAFLGVSENTLVKWRKTGKGPKYNDDKPNMRLYLLEDLEEYLATFGPGKYAPPQDIETILKNRTAQAHNKPRVPWKTR